MASRARSRTSYLSLANGKHLSSNLVKNGYEGLILSAAGLSSSGTAADTGTSGTLPLYMPAAPTSGRVGGVPIYRGAFIASDGDQHGDSKCSYTEALRICQGSQTDRMFMTGYLANAVAEIAIPAVSTSTNINDLTVATMVQNYKFLSVPDPIPSSLRINGLSTISGQLIVGATNWYADNNEPRNYGVYANAASISTATQKGMHRVTGARHNAGWLTPIPAVFQAALGATHLQGYGGGVSIESYAPSGISFYAVNAADILAAATGGGVVSATVLADYTVDGGAGMDGDLYTSQMWNWLSSCGGYFFVPNTRTILCFGQSWDYRVTRGGSTVNNRIYYKDQTTPTGVGRDEDGQAWSNGFFAYLPEAYCNFCWAYDVDDLIAVKNGTKAANTVKPYWYGPLDLFPFCDRLRVSSLINGVFYREDQNRVYFSSQRGATDRFVSTPTIGTLELVGVPA